MKTITRKCRLIAMLLAIAMLIALAPVTAMAANNITLNKSAYSINEPMIVMVTGLTQDQTNSRTYVSIYKVGARPDQYGKWERVNSLIAGEWKVAAPAEPGNYEMRVYSADPATDADLVDMAQLTVKYFTENNITVNLNKSAYDSDEEMTVVVSGATNEQIQSRAYVAIYMVGARADQWGSWTRISSLIAGEWKVKAPREAGNYEIRVYVVDPPVDDALITMVPFSSGTGVAPPASATTPPTTTSAPSTSAPTASATPEQTPAPPATSAPPSSTVSGAAVGTPQFLTVESGIKLEWSAVPGAVGYRVYRSRVSGVEGISVTDFIITSTSYVDVSVDANTTYYYTIRAVMKEAVAATGEREQLGEPSSEITATTGSSILGGNASDLDEGVRKNVILMKLDDPNMSVNGIQQEVDPGRGTFPSLVSNRTMVPLRSVAETMGGTVLWDQNGEQDIHITGGGNVVEMWLGRRDLIVNGESKEMDVAPSTINDRTMVPVRFVAENLGCVVDWISSTQEIVIVFYTGGKAGQQPTVTQPTAEVTPEVTTEPTPEVTPTPTATPELTPEPPTQPSGSIDQNLVGVWGTGFNVLGDWHSAISGSYQYSSGSIRGVEFRADGTFDVMMIISGSTGSLQEIFKGSYSTEGNTIYFSNVMYKETSIDRNGNIKDSSHDFIAVDDQRIYYDISDFNNTQQLSFGYGDNFLVTSGVIHFGTYTSLYPLE